MKKILNLKLVIVWEFQSTKTFFPKGYTQNWSEGVFVISQIKNTVPWTYVISDLNGKEIVGTFYEKTNKKEFRIEKIIKKKGNKLYVKWKGVHLVVGLMKKALYTNESIRS